MKKWKIIFGFFWCLGLILLFLAASTDLFFDESNTEIYRISVIWDDADEKYVKGYRDNISRYNLKQVEYHFCTLEKDLSAKGQMELIAREEEQGADLVVVKPFNEKELQELLNESGIRVPVICMDGKMESDKVKVSIYSDEAVRGRSLTQRICREHKGAEICVLAEGRDPAREESIFYAIKEQAQKAGQRAHQCSWKRGDDLPHGDEPGQTVLVAWNPGMLETAAGQAKDGTALYGLGYTDSILHEMEQGKIQAISVHSNFYMGWTAIRYAFKILNGEGHEREVVLEDFTVGAEEMFEPEYEDILFYIGRG